ncbi:TetR/AcrR family transcriptional regulator [Brevibacillus humidisoli]|uniref:TetR/AcrR family transcriptional regulator n=1 Tax=Brevibacillus humidisoli TaxID=2895522 RepID=UPI001E494770|nr:TetR/AcrR family transcriptional regulator [Brevibacillus humidisoli]UFJ40787.1 TetR/AcrR family transcriptional regulator [Brevibacillus humidisoli]
MPQEGNHNPSFQLLLSTTEQLIEEKGCRNTTLQEIINRSGLSKGAIYHYVRSKDELFGLVLQTRLEAVNERFFSQVNAGKKELDHPLQAIAEGLQHIHDPKDVTNQIFVYLVSQRDNPAIARLLQDLYQLSLQTSVNWIETGQQNGVIPSTLDARRIADMFIVISYGFRLRSMVTTDENHFSIADFHQVMRETLQ